MLLTLMRQWTDMGSMWLTHVEHSQKRLLLQPILVSKAAVHAQQVRDWGSLDDQMLIEEGRVVAHWQHYKGLASVVSLSMRQA